MENIKEEIFFNVEINNCAIKTAIKLKKWWGLFKVLQYLITMRVFSLCPIGYALMR